MYRAIRLLSDEPSAQLPTGITEETIGGIPPETVIPDPSSDLGTNDVFSETVSTPSQAIDELLLIVSTAFVFQMQLSFALLENGMVRPKNSKNILIKNVFDMCAGTLAFWLIGFGLAFGPDDTGKGSFI